MKSIWMENTDLPKFDTLRQDIKTDVLIIGGGLAGLLCGYFLEQAGTNYTIIEADRICGGVTGYTTAKLTSQHGLVYRKLIHRFGAEKARLYFEANEAALGRYREICRDIDCDFEEKDAYVYALEDQQKLEKELLALERMGANAKFIKRLPLPMPTVGAIRFPEQAQFHPLKFAAAIAGKLNIYENTRALSYEGCRSVLTDYGRIQADRIVVASHFPIYNKHGNYFLKLYQHRSYVLGLENGPDVDGMYVDESGKGLSFRNYGNCLLLGGGSHRTGKQGGNWKELETFARKYYPDSPIRYQWATQDCMSLDGMPYIGQYSPSTPDVYVAAGFNKWGMTGAMAAAMLLSDLLLDKKNDYAAVFSPSRSILHPQLFCNLFETTANLLTPTKPRCPHMGCALKWNAQERSWDCPCHGSRFTADGKRINNPAEDDLKYK